MKINVNITSQKEIDLGDFPIYRKDAAHFWQILSENSCNLITPNSLGVAIECRDYLSENIAETDESNQYEFMEAYLKVQNKIHLSITGQQLFNNQLQKAS